MSARCYLSARRRMKALGNEVLFCEGDPIGNTREQLRSLHFPSQVTMRSTALDIKRDA